MLELTRLTGMSSALGSQCDGQQYNTAALMVLFGTEKKYKSPLQTSFEPSFPQVN